MSTLGVCSRFMSLIVFLGSMKLLFSSVSGQLVEEVGPNTQPVIVIFFDEKEFDGQYYNILQEEMVSAFENSTIRPAVQWMSVVDGMFKQVSFENKGSLVISVAGCKFNQLLLEMIRVASVNVTNVSLNVLISSEPCSRSESFVHISANVHFYVTPLDRFELNVVQVFRDLQQTGQLDWDDMTILFDATADRKFIQDVLDDVSQLFSASGAIVSVELHQIPSNKTDIPQFAQQIFQERHQRRKSEENFLFICNQDSLLPLLKAANDAEFLNLKSQFFIVWNSLGTFVNNDLSDLDTLLKSYTTNIAILRPNFQEYPDHASYTSHLQVQFHHLVRRAFEVAKFAWMDEHNSTELTEDEDEDGISQVKPILNNITQMSFIRSFGPLMPLISGINYTWALHSHLADEVSRSHQIKSSEWTIGHGFDQSVCLFPYLTEGLQDVELTVVTLHSPPNQIIKPKVCKNVSECTFSGVTFNILEELRRRLKFRYKIKVIEASAHFWNETVSMLKNKEAHFAAIGLVIRADRRKDVDFTVPFFSQPYTILSAMPKRAENMFMHFMALKQEVWIATFVAIFMLAFSIYLLQCTHRYINPELASTALNSRQIDFSYKRYCFTLFGILYQQGMTTWPTYNATRVALAAWLLSSLVIVSTYNGNIVAFITIPRIHRQIRNLEDLIMANKSVTWGSHLMSPLHLHLDAANDERMMMVRERIEWHANLKNETVWNRIINENHVIVESRSSIFEQLNERPELAKNEKFIIGDELFFDAGALAVCKKFPFLPIINKGIKDLLATGLIYKYFRDVAHKEKNLGIGVPLVQERSVILSISMKNFGGIFFLLLFGFIIGIIFFVFEIGIETMRMHTGDDLSTIVY